jgi:hypothetical protein
MDTELIAKDARSRAIEQSPYRIITTENKLDLVEELKQIYFHAGRWSAGSRDYLAREAYKQYSRRERLAK